MFIRIRNAAVWLTTLEIWLVALGVAASMVSTRVLPVVLGVAAFFWLVRWIANGKPGVRTPADWGVAWIMLMIPVTLWATALPDKTLLQVFRLLSGIALFYAVANWARTPERLRWAVTGVILAGVGLAIFASVSVQWSVGKLPFIPVSFYERFSVLVSDTVHPNVMAGSLVILLPLLLAMLLFGGRSLGWIQWILMLILTLGMTGVLALTQSRGAWIALAVVLVLLPLLRWRWGWIALLLAAAGGGVAVYRFGISPVVEILASSNTLGGVEGRIEVWSRAIYMIQDFSFTGVGIGSFGDVADVLYPFFMAAPGSIPHAHNLFLQVAVDLGIPGLIAWLAVLLTVVLTSWRVYRHGRAAGNGWLAGLGAGLLCSQLALMVHGLTDAVTWGMVRPAPIVWGLWGLAMAASSVFIPSPVAVSGEEIEEKGEEEREE